MEILSLSTGSPTIRKWAVRVCLVWMYFSVRDPGFADRFWIPVDRQSFGAQGLTINQTFYIDAAYNDGVNVVWKSDSVPSGIINYGALLTESLPGASFVWGTNNPTQTQEWGNTYAGYGQVFPFSTSATVDLTTGQSAPLKNFTWIAPGNPFMRLDQDRLDRNRVGEPVQLATGAESRHLELFHFQGARNWKFEITYNSAMFHSSAPMANGFGHNFQAHLEFNLPSAIVVSWNQGRFNLFNAVTGQPNTYVSAEDGGRYDIISLQNDQSWLLTYRDKSTLRFDSTGQLIEDTDRFGRKLVLTYAGGNLSKITEPVSNTSLSFTYDGNGYLSTLVDSASAAVSFAYTNQTGLWTLTKITDQNGHATNYSYDSAWQLTTITDDGGNPVITNTNSNGKVSSQTDGRGHVTTFTYGGTTVVTDPDGHAQTATFDQNYNETSTSDAFGNVTNFTYDSSNRMTSMKDALNRITLYTYDNAGNLLTVTDPAGKVTTSTYDSNNNLLSVTDSIGHVTTRTYDSNNNVISETDALGNTTSWTYDSNSLPLTQILPRGGVFHYTYTSGQLTQMIDPDGITETFGYDADGRVLAVTDALGKRRTFSYDAVGNRVSERDALNNLVNTTFDVRDRPVQVTDATGAITTSVYDNNGNLSSVTDALSHTTTKTYDAENRLIASTDPLSRVTAYAWDADGRLTSITDPSGNIMRTTYDVAGQVVSITDPLHNTTTFGYESRGLLAMFVDPLSRSTSYSYDFNGSRLGSVDPLNRPTNYSYDSLNRPTSITDAGNRSVLAGFDADGNNNSLTNPAGKVVSASFTPSGRLSEKDTPQGRRTTMSYDSRGLLHTITKPSGATRNLNYDDAGRLSSSSDSVGTVQLTRDGDGRILSTVEGNKTITRTYNYLGQLISYTDGVGNVVGYQYNAAGQLSVLTYPGGRQVSYLYDSATRLQSVQDWAGRITTYTYDADGRVTKISRPNGTSQVRTYDAGNQLTHINDVASDGSAIIYSVAYEYNAAGELSKSSGGGYAPSGALDAQQTFNDDDELVSQNGSAASYDADGNLVSVAGSFSPSTYVFDSRDRLIAAGALTYIYDAESRRVGVVNSTATTNYAYDPRGGLDRLLIRTTPDGTTTFYVYGLGLLYDETTGTAQYYHFDQRGDTIALSGSTGSVSATISYDGYGKVISKAGTVNTPFLFGGYFGIQTDSNGLYFHRSRYFSPALRRWLSRDPIVQKGGPNLYSYVAGDPIDLVDPTGLIQVPRNPNAGPGIDTQKWLPTTFFVYVEKSTKSNFGSAMVSGNFNRDGSVDNSFLFTTSTPGDYVQTGAQWTGQPLVDPLGGEKVPAIQVGKNFAGFEAGAFATDDEISIYFGFNVKGVGYGIGFGWDNPYKQGIDNFGRKMLKQFVKIPNSAKGPCKI